MNANESIPRGHPGPAARWTLIPMLAALFAAALTASAPGEPPVFVVDFDTLNTGEPTDHDYTPAERTQIIDEMNGLFGPLGMVVAPVPPPKGPYSTVFFNAAAAGTSDGIDFRNVDKTDTASVNAIMMLSVVGFDPAEMTSEMIVRASINIGVHEALHLVGARHQDAFAPPGTGLPFTGLADDYLPPYPGPIAAPLTDEGFESLTLVLGLSAEKLLQDDLFVSPRTAMKAILGETVPVTEQVPGNITPLDAQLVLPTTIAVPNTLPPDLDLSGFPLPPCADVTNLEFIATVAVVSGDLLDPPLNPPNYYVFPIDLPPGAMLVPPSFTVEIFSEVLDHRLTPIDTALWVLDPGPPAGPGFLPVDYFGTDAFNEHGIETDDPAIVDLPPPPYPTLVVEVAPQEPPDLAGGEYELIIYSLGAFIMPCLGDIDGDGSVGTADLLLLLGAWGPCPQPCPPTCPADLDGDCVVGTADLLILLANWT